MLHSAAACSTWCLLSVGYRPLLDPVAMDRWWLLLLPPLVIGIAVVYKALKLDDLSEVPRQSLALAFQIIGFLVLAAVVLLAVTEMT
jgi:hypothetical protein